MDFGISKVMGDSLSLPSMTRTSQLMGTPHYMSPEQVRDASSVTAASDVYSLGVLMFELLCGRLPFEAESLAELCAAHLHASPPSLQSLYPQVPAELETVVMLCLDKVAERRPTAAELALELSSLADAMGAPGAESFVSTTSHAEPVAHLATLAM